MSTIIGADTIEKQDKSENQLETAHIYIKVFFSILQGGENDTHPIENSVAEGLVLRDVIGSNKKYIDIENKIHETVIIDCSELFVDDFGHVSDSEGQFFKILEAIEEVHTIIDANKAKYERGIVHIAVFGFEIIEDTASGFSYLIDQDNSLGVIDEKLCSYILSLPPLFEDLKYNWFMWTDYMGVFEYYHLYQPINGSVNKLVTISSHTKLNGDISTTNVAQEQINETSRPPLRGYVAKSNLDDNEKHRGWLDTTQLILEGVGLLPIPAVSEISSLVNGVIYLGKEIHAGLILGDYDKMYDYRNQAVSNFVYAIPGTSILKGTVKVVRAGRAVQNVHRAENAVVAARRSKKIAEQALRRVRKGNTTKINKAVVKTNNKNAAQMVKDEQQNLQNAIEERTRRLNESGLTIRDLTNESRNILQRGYRNYRNVMNTSDKILRGQLPDTVIDKSIDNIDKAYRTYRNQRDINNHHPQ